MSAVAELDFVHRFLPGRPEEPTLLLLHGTGGNEDDLLPLGRAVAPGAAMLSPRGRVLERGMPRFFRRLGEGVFDQEDLRRQALALASFVADAAIRYGFNPSRLVALGYSNGANIASAAMLLRPEIFAAAVLLRPMLPFEPETMPDLRDKKVFIGAGLCDPMVPRANTERLIALFQSAGARVDTMWHRGGHALVNEEVEQIAAWLAAYKRPARL